MTARPRFFKSQAAMLTAVVLSLSLAEGEYVLLGLTLAVVGLQMWRRRRRRRALLNNRASYVIVIAAFVFMILELSLLGGIPVLALSHFLILVCLCLLLQEQRVRDQGQFFVLCLLLLVVASIVSADLLFPFVLALFLSVGLGTLVRFHLLLERARTEQHNQAVRGRMLESGETEQSSAAGVLTKANVVMGLIAVVLFVASPRVGAGLLGRFDTRTYGDAASGTGRALTFERVGPIHLSDEQVMSVRVEDEFGRAQGPEAGDPYFRGAVFDQYCRRRRYWEWRVATPNGFPPREAMCESVQGRGGAIPLIPGVDAEFESPVCRQKYWLQPGEQNFLYVMYPALEIRSQLFDEVRKRLRDQVLPMEIASATGIRYEVVSGNRRLPRVLRQLEREREHEASPEVFPPEPALPREAEIRRLVDSIDEKANTRGALDDPDKRKRFVDAAIGYLNSPEFSYTLQPSTVQRGREPIGDFLLAERRGHCEYFASALVVMCQYRGIPARLATGYLGGDYNAVGGYYVVRQRYAHAWTEVYVPGEDWVTYDPTPAEGRSALGRRWSAGIYKYLDYLQFQWHNQVVAYDNNVRRALLANFTEWLRRPAGYRTTWYEAVLAFISEMIFWRAQMSLSDRLLYYAFTVTVLALIVMVAYLLVLLGRAWVLLMRRRWTTVRRAGPGPEAEFYLRFCRRLERLGLRRRRDQTPAEFASELACRHARLAGATELVRAYYDVAFGRQPLSRDRRENVEMFLRGLARLDPAQLARRPATG